MHCIFRREIYFACCLFVRILFQSDIGANVNRYLQSPRKNDPQINVDTSKLRGTNNNVKQSKYECGGVANS